MRLSVLRRSSNSRPITENETKFKLNADRSLVLSTVNIKRLSQKTTLLFSCHPITDHITLITENNITWTPVFFFFFFVTRGKFDVQHNELI